MGKRKARNKLAKTLDIMMPITLEKLGSKDDPCFGKLHDARNSTCQKCGDSELCCVAMGQINHMKRLKAESKGSFKDLEEQDIPEHDKKEVRKMVKNRIRELVKGSESHGIPMESVLSDVHAIYFDKGWTKKRITKLIDAMVEKSDHLSKTKNTLRWK